MSTAPAPQALPSSFAADLAAGRTPGPLDPITYAVPAGITLRRGQVLQGQVVTANGQITARTTLVFTGSAATGVYMPEADAGIDKVAIGMGGARPELSGQRTIGVQITGDGCRVTGSAVTGCVAGNGPGGAVANGVGIVLGGRRGFVSWCQLHDLGTPAAKCDGVYASGDYHVIEQCNAVNVTDTAFVLERCNFGLVRSCQTLMCASGLAITNAGQADCYGNVANDVLISGWGPANTGAVCLGTLSPTYGGDLYDTTLRDVRVFGGGVGPGINCRRIGPGEVVGLTLDAVTVAGARQQGMLFDRVDTLRLHGCAVAATGFHALQLVGCQDVLIAGKCSFAEPPNRKQTPMPYAVCLDGQASPVSDLVMVGNALGGGSEDGAVMRLGQVVRDTVVNNAFV